MGVPREAAAGRDGVSPINGERETDVTMRKHVHYYETSSPKTRFRKRDSPHNAPRPLADVHTGLVLVRAPMTAAALEESAEELLERLGDIGVSCDDLTVEDVLYQAVPNRFVRVGAHLASDVATVVATGLVGVSDSDGTEAAVSAIYRSAANAGNNPTAAAARLEQGLRRLAAALDDTDAGAAGRVSVVAILNALVTYVQVGTMLAQRRSKANATGKDDDTTIAAAGEFDLRPGSDMDATPSHPSLDPPKHTSLDPAQTVRVSKQLWRVVNGVRVDDGVAKTLASSGYGGYGSAGNSSQLPSTSHAPCALSLLDAVLAAVRRALKALPSDHLLTAVALTDANKLTAPEKTMLESVNSALSEEYATRKETVQRRAWLTVQAFGQSARLVKGNCAPQITSLFSKRAGFGANGDAVGDDGDESENENDDALPVTSKVSLADAWDCRVADLARGTYWDFPKSKHCLPIHD